MGLLTKVMIIRHAEKPVNSIKGVNAAGTQDPESLIVQGWQRAGALIGLFDPDSTVFSNSALATPDKIYASNPGTDGSERPLETITPLAAKLVLTPDESFVKGQEKHLAEDVLKQSGIVLICWQHQKIHSIAKHLTKSGPPSPPIPDPWPGDRFDLVFVFTPPTQAGQLWTLTQVPQLLLAGDLSTVLPPGKPTSPDAPDEPESTDSPD
jgi:hypothetical protein